MSELVLPQFGIFAQGAYAHHFLEFDLHPGVTGAEAVASFRRLRVPEVSAGGVNLVIAFGARTQIMSAITDDHNSLNAGVDAIQPGDSRTSYAELARSVRAKSPVL